MDNVIEIKNLIKNYGEVKAVDGVSFTVPRGALFAFLGVNGAGKSTTINILCSILNRDGGDVTIDGKDLDRDREQIKMVTGIVFQSSYLDERLSVRDNLTVRASYYGLRGETWKKRLTELSDMLELNEILSRPFGKLSGGQKRRVDIARGLINSPKILFLDEPTTGLDPGTRKAVWSILEKLRRDTGMTIFLTTHYMEEADRADKVVIIDHGKIVAEGTPVELKARYTGDYVKLYRTKTQAMDKLLASSGAEFTYSGDAYSVKTRSSSDALKFILSHKDEMGEFEVIKGDMDDVFLNATKRKGGSREN